MPISEVTNEDNMLMMARYPDGFFDVAIIDPPYAIKQDGYRDNNRSKLAKSKKYHKAVWDQPAPSKEFFAELMRVSKNQIIFGANHFIENLPINSPCWIVWDKDNQGSNFADCELAWTSFPTAVRKVKIRWNGMLQEDMKNKEIRIHDTQKPVALYAWIIKNYVGAGAIVLDTHLGSGSNRIAAYDAGVNFYGCELEKQYFDDQEKRFKNHAAQQKLFIPTNDMTAQAQGSFI